MHYLDCPGEDELECHCGEYYVEIVDTLTNVDGMNRGKVKLHNNVMDLAFKSMILAESMKENGLMTKLMDKVFILIQMEPNMMAAGRMTCKMVQE